MASVKAIVRLVCPAQAAKPGPSIGQALGPHGLNMSEFVKQFNAATASVPLETPVPVVLTAYTNRTFTFITKSPPASYLIRKELGIEKGASNPGSEVVGKITMDQIKAIAKQKHDFDEHLQDIPFESFCRSVAGTAASMGVEVIGDVASKNPGRRRRKQRHSPDDDD